LRYIAVINAHADSNLFCATISAILDMKRPPTGRLGLENVYVMLSRISSWDGLAILRPFEDSVLQGVPDERLVVYDDFLEKMHIDTRNRIVAI